jgi:hypothetical protein
MDTLAPAPRTSLIRPRVRLTWPRTDWTWQRRIDNYRHEFNRESFLTFIDGERPWLYGVWLQADFRRNAPDLHGSYPGDYLRRIDALFPDKTHTLHVFSGKVDLTRMPGDTLDIRAELGPTYCVNAETCEGVPLERYDLAVADPPYALADAEKYGTKLPVASRVMTALERLPVGAHVVWLDERVPGYRRKAFIHEGIIGLSTSAGHRFRVISIFRRVAA